MAASADSQLDPKEKEWILGYAESMGASNDLVRELDTIEPKQLKALDFGKDFEKFLQRDDLRSRAAKKGIIFDCIRAASADGIFHTDERKAVVDLALRFRLTEGDVQILEALVQEEKQLKAKKAQLVHH